MRKIAVFGNAGAGKSTLARRLAELTGIPLFPLDRLQFKPGGGKIDHQDYLAAHAELLRRETWIIDGYGDLATTWGRLREADTLVYLDLPLMRHRWWVTKRLLQSVFRAPEGWPERSPIWRSTLDSYRVIGLCHQQLTPRYRLVVAEAAASKRVFHLRSPAAIAAFLAQVRRDCEPHRDDRGSA